MIAKRILSSVSLALALALMVTGCGGIGNLGNDGATVSLAPVMTFLLQQTGSDARSFTADDVMTGELAATNTDSGEVTVFTWSVYLDAETLEVASNKTVVLEPGSYDFAMEVTAGDYQYAGQALMQTIADGQNTINLVLRPVIGVTSSVVEIVDRVADFRFDYDPDELAGLDAPQIGIQVDDHPEQIFDINPATGLSEHMFLNLEPGTHMFRLKLYDGGLQRGKSITEQEVVTVVPGVNVTMDLVALHGEVAFSLTEEGGTAVFDLTLPGEIVEEAGGVDQLDALLRAVGDENPLQEVLLELSTTDAGETYRGSVSFDDYQYGLVTVSVEFTDNGDGQPLGTAVGSVDLNKDDQTVALRLTLRRRAVITGNLLGTLGINVLSESSEPVAGAVVTVDGENVGITGGGSFGTAGYLKVYARAGTHEILATGEDRYGEATVNVDALGIDNVDLYLDSLLVVVSTDPEATVTAWPDGSFVARHQIRNIDGDGDGAVDDLRISRIQFDVTAGTTVVFDSLVLEVSGTTAVDLNGDGDITGFDNQMILFSGTMPINYNDDYSTAHVYNQDGSVHSYDSIIAHSFPTAGTYMITVGQLRYQESAALAGFHPNRSFRDYPRDWNVVPPPSFDHGDWQLTITPSSGSVSNVFILADPE